MNQELAGAKHSWKAGPRYSGHINFSHENGAVLLYLKRDIQILNIYNRIEIHCVQNVFWH